MMQIPRSEYPRPDFVRENWISLNGQWDFSFEKNSFERQITVPFACESKLSGIEDKGFHYKVWYRKKFVLTEKMRDKIVLLHFGAVDYSCKIWVNHILLSEHEGGQTSFSVDITEALEEKENTIIVEAMDDHSDLEMPRGKQFWEKKSRSIFYTRTTGIWQSVWLEAISTAHLCSVKITPLFDEKSVRFDYVLSGKNELSLETQILFQNEVATDMTVKSKTHKGSFSISLNEPSFRAWNFYEDLTWSPENPRLFDVVFRVYENDTLTDEVQSYFGIRKISIDNGIFMLNNRPYFQKLVLDQGYWEDSLQTAPRDEDFIEDIRLVKSMGFNGVRKHQKVEDPRFLYHADRMGLLVWGEIGSAYLYSSEYAQRMYREWLEVIERDYNHPCIVTWVPLNESWGVQEIKTNNMQQRHANALYNITKSLDDTRVVVDNDGWEHTCGDLLTIHDYDEPEKMQGRYNDIETILKFTPAGKFLFANGWEYKNQPIILSEYGGIAYPPIHDDSGAWGYSEVNNEEDFLKKYEALINVMIESELIQGFCYTQLTDIENERNGLLFYDRTPKISLDKIQRINDLL